MSKPITPETKSAATTDAWRGFTTEDVRKYAAEQGIAEEEALKMGMEEKSKEFVSKGAEVYTNA